MEQPDVVAVWLFGSLAQGTATPRSDVDVAVLLTEEGARGANFMRQLGLMNQVECFADREMDVVVLNDAPLILQTEVLRARRLLYERDRAARIAYQVQAGKEWADLEPMREFVKRDLILRAKEGRFGQRRRHRISPA